MLFCDRITTNRVHWLTPDQADLLRYDGEAELRVVVTIRASQLRDQTTDVLTSILIRGERLRVVTLTEIFDDVFHLCFILTHGNWRSYPQSSERGQIPAELLFSLTCVAE